MSASRNRPHGNRCPSPLPTQEAAMNDFIEQALMAPLELLSNHVTSILPNILAMTILLLGGILVAWLSSRSVERLLHVLGFDHLCNRLGMTGALLRAGIKTDPSRVIGGVLYWTILVVASVAALSALNLTPINEAAHSLLAYLPHLVTAGVILLAGY